jgi:hypothetical protein
VISALAIIGAIPIILAAAATVPPAISALIRAFIPMVSDFRDLYHAMCRRENRADDASDQAADPDATGPRSSSPTGTPDQPPP